MPKVFVEQRRDSGDFAVERPDCKRASGLFETQAEAIEFARNLSDQPTVEVERVRHTTVNSPDKWRKP